ncbi:MAG: glycine zipper 2TM domain-containing protein [Betaproteobacteria bacterium]|nr:glycine zipper 2TM domain-containing protein [Betaproteobacteria bacterium]
METKAFGKKLMGRNGLLYPMLVVAAISVIIFSAFGVAMMTGLLPRAESINEPHAMTKNRVAGRADKTCNNCGVIEAINAVEVTGQGTGLGAVAGGVTGALIGNQIGRGSGNTVATIAGAAGGAFAGNEIEKNMKKAVRYQVRVRMNDGTLRTTYYSSAPAFAIGDKVKIVNGQVVAAG